MEGIRQFTLRDGLFYFFKIWDIGGIFYFYMNMKWFLLKKEERREAIAFLIVRIVLIIIHNGYLL